MRFPRSTRFLLAGLPLASAMTGCRDDDLMNHRRFVLTSIDGAALPALEHQTVSGRYLAVADTIVFTSATRGFHTRVVRVEPTNTQPVEITRSTTEFTYEFQTTGFDVPPPAGSIALSYVCPNDIVGDCLPGPHLGGILHETSLSLRVLHQSPERERLYIRR